MAIACAFFRACHEQELGCRRFGRARSARSKQRVHASLARQVGAASPHRAGRPSRILFADRRVPRQRQAAILHGNRCRERERSILFPGLKPDRFGRRAGNGSKRVQRWVRNKVKITHKRKAPSHSWRHRFRSILRNPKYGIPEDVADYMAGHGGNGGEGRDYGAYRDAMVEAISRLPSHYPS
jgi:hypothetical protein